MVGLGLSDTQFREEKRKHSMEITMLLQSLVYGRVPRAADMLAKFDPNLFKLADDRNISFFFLF